MHRGEAFFEELTIHATIHIKQIRPLMLARLALSASVALYAASAQAQSTWVSQTIPGTHTNRTLRGIEYNGTQFVCVGDSVENGFASILTSPDGIAWTAAPDTTSKNLRGIAFSPTLWIACGEDETILTSADGITWLPQTVPPPPPPNPRRLLSDVAYGGGKYVAVGGAGKIIVSSDAISWSDATTVPIQAFLQSVAYGGGKFVAVGVSGTIMHSADGLVWTAASAGTSTFLNRVTYANGLFVIIGQGGTIITSPDAANWTQRTSGTASPLRSIEFADTRFIVGGDSGTILGSDDGITWEPQTSGIVESTFGMAYGAGEFVAAGGKLDPSHPGATLGHHQLTQRPRPRVPVGDDYARHRRGHGPATFNIVRIGPTDTPACADWSVTGGTAVSPDEFTDTLRQCPVCDRRILAPNLDPADRQRRYRSAADDRALPAGGVIRHGHPRPPPRHGDHPRRRGLRRRRAR